ncbi:alpha/beta hydrolase [Andreprevotia chitinilytica]|uniref:alpha/beta hydrolase n=1 Tax=Andreprevotia chitinilytica TaxID=396808 RepID=UPI000559682F|nr:alpha/beta hydrolase [Andreprevotia chitinilytica]
MSIKRISLFILATALAIVLAILMFYYFNQEKMLFYPRSLDPAMALKLQQPSERADAVRITAPDGTDLHGWLLKANTNKPAPMLIYFGGNDEEVSWLAKERRFFPEWNILLMNYRGYGLSKGTPGEAALEADALIIYDTFAHHAGIDSQNIFVLGHSLGTGVAVYLAQHRQLTGVALISPYDSVQNVAQEMYPYLPVGLLLKHPFDSLSRAPGIKSPALFVVGDQDHFVSPAHSNRLFGAWAGPKEWNVIGGANHNSILDLDACWQSVQQFLNRIAHNKAA